MKTSRPIPTAAPATMQPVTVTGSRPSEDFQVTKTSINRLGAADLMDVPQSVIVINKALMESQGATSLQSAIRNVPGITIGAAEGGTIGNNFNINGFSARTDLYLDGMRDRGQYYRDVFALEQIEVLFGPSSLLFGRGSTGGVINQVTKKPGLKNATELSASVTTNGLVRTTADVNVPFGQDSSNAARVNAMFQYGKASTVDMTTVQDFGFAPAVKFGIGTPTQITLQALMQHNHDQVPYGVPPLNGFPLNVPRNTAYGFSDDFTNQDVISVVATVDHAFNKDFKLRNQIDVQLREHLRARDLGQCGRHAGSQRRIRSGRQWRHRHAVQRRAAQPALCPPAEPRPQHLRLHARQPDRAVGEFRHRTVRPHLPAGRRIGLRELLEPAILPQRHLQRRAAAGIERHDGLRRLHAGRGHHLDQFSPSNVAQQYGNLASAQAWTAAGYFNDTVQVMPWLKLVGGLRLDYYYAQIGNSQNSANIFGNTTVPYFVQPITFLSTRAGAIVEPTREQSYYFSYSTSFNPSLEQLTSTTGAAQLPPEQNEAFEAGAKFELLNGNLSLNAALFQITKTNARTQNPDGTFSATGTVRVKGVRTGVTGRITPEWQVFGGYAYLDGRIIDGIGAGTQGNVPLNTPRDSGTIWSTYTFKETYEIGGGATYIGYRYANNTNTVVVPDFVRLDMTAAYRQPTYDVRLNIFNLTNTMYYEQVIASDGGRAVAGSGLTAMLTYTHRL